MSWDLKSILESKDAFHKELSMRPIGEKLAMLDKLLARTEVIRNAAAADEKRVDSDGCEQAKQGSGPA